MVPHPTLLLPILLTFLLSIHPSVSPGVAPRPPQVSSSRDNQIPIPTPLPVIGKPNPFAEDPCGPNNIHHHQSDSDGGKPGSKSTCAAVVDGDLPTGSPFKLGCEKDNTGYTINWDTCRASVNYTCGVLSLGTNVAVDKWVWVGVGASAPPSTPRLNCSVGFWNPSYGALLPDFERCKRDIFGAMIEGCAKDKANNVAAVNLKKLPHRTATERFTGEAVDAGYPSYLIVAQNYVPGAET